MQGRTHFILTLIFLAFATGANAQIISDFATGNDGWLAPNSATGLTYNATGGNPNGMVAGTPVFVNFGNGPFYFPWYFVAPPKFLGNRSTYYSGTLRYENQMPTSAASSNRYEVMLGNSAIDTVYYYPTFPFQPVAAPAWGPFFVVMNNQTGFWKTAAASTAPAASEALMQQILANVTSLEIRGLYRDANVTTRLDNVSLAPPINVTTQPITTAVCAGQIATLTTAANGNPAITYQWQMVEVSGAWIPVTNGGAYSGATTATLSINTTGNAGAGIYRARISGSLVVDAFSNPATVGVNTVPTPPTVTGASSCLPGSLTLSANGASNGIYRWYTTSTLGQPISGTSGSTFTTPSITATTTYYVGIYNGVCESTRIPAVATIGGSTCNKPPVFATTFRTTIIGSKVSIDLLPLVTDADNNLNLNSFTIVKAPASGATATLNQTSLTIDYATKAFSGTDSLRLSVCDNQPLCVQQKITIQVDADIIVYNALSPGKNGKNDFMYIEHIEILASTKKNRVSIFNRWGDLVWEGNDYDNNKVTFTGKSSKGSDLPSGTYFYKIDFDKHSTVTGYLEIKN